MNKETGRRTDEKNDEIEKQKPTGKVNWEGTEELQEELRESDSLEESMNFVSLYKLSDVREGEIEF